MKQTNNTDEASLTPDLFTITDLETLKAVSSPFRQNLMRLMSEKPRTVKEMAEELDMPPSRLYYHINQLAKYGIIRVAKTQIVSGIVEKHYQISARAFRVDRALLAPGGGNDDAIIDVLMAGTLDAAEKEIRQGIRSGIIDMSKSGTEPGAIFIGHAVVSLTSEQYSDFKQRLFDLYQEFEAMETPPDDASVQLSGLLIAFYPIASQKPND